MNTPLSNPSRLHPTPVGLEVDRISEALVSFSLGLGTLSGRHRHQEDDGTCTVPVSPVSRGYYTTSPLRPAPSGRGPSLPDRGGRSRGSGRGVVGRTGVGQRNPGRGMSRVCHWKVQEVTQENLSLILGVGRDRTVCEIVDQG